MKKLFLFFIAFVAINTSFAQVITIPTGENAAGWLCTVNNSATWTPPAGWATLGYNTAGWTAPAAGTANSSQNATTGIMWGVALTNDYTDQVINNTARTSLFRYKFTLNQVCTSFSFRVRADNDVRVFLNGALIAGPTANSTQFLNINLQTAGVLQNLVCGENVLAFQATDAGTMPRFFELTNVNIVGDNNSIPQITGPSSICFSSATPATFSMPSGYLYQWNTGATTPSITPATSGTYTVTVKSGCQVTRTKSIQILPSPIPVVNVTNISCTGTSASVSLTSSATGGSAPYTYLWSNGATTQNLTNVPYASYYRVTVTDANGCINRKIIYPCNPCSSNSSGLTAPDNESKEQTNNSNTSDRTSVMATDEDFNIFPNPTTGDLVVNTSKEYSERSEILVSDILGSVVLRVNVTQEAEKVDISKLAPGIYIFSLIKEGELIGSQKVLKQE